MRPLLEPRHFKFIKGGRWGSKSITVCKILLSRGNSEKATFLFTREIQESIEASIYADLKRLIEDLNYTNYKVTEKNIVNNLTGSNFIFKGLARQDKRQTVKSLSRVKYCMVEEAQSISKASLDILVPTIRDAGSELWFLYNPFLPDDPVELLRQSIPDDEKIDIEINAFDNPFNSKETLKDIARLKDQYDRGVNQDYLHIVLGQPIGFSDFTVFRIADIQSTINRQVSDEGQIQIGVDIARMGGDKTILVKRKGLKMIDYKMFPMMKGDILLNEIVSFCNKDTSVKIKVDETGIAGGYIVDFLTNYGYNAESVSFGRQAKEPDKYNNAISEMWFEFQSKIDTISLMDIPELKSQLCTREYFYDKQGIGKKCIESKDSYKKRGFKSPDFADAVLLCFYDTDNNLIVSDGKVRGEIDKSYIIREERFKY